MAEASTSLPPAAEALLAWLIEGQANVGALKVEGVDAVWDEDSEGEPIIRLLVTLADPVDDTWPLKDVSEFHRRVNDRARSLPLTAPWYTAIEAATKDELDPEDVPA